MYLEHSARQPQTLARWVGCTFDKPGLIHQSFHLKHNDLYLLLRFSKSFEATE